MRTPLTLALSLVVGTSGCSTVEPPKLEGSPANSALVLVDCDVQNVQALFNTHARIGQVEGLLGGQGTPPPSHHGWSLDGAGLLVFSDVEPGRWTLTSLRAAFRSNLSTNLANEALAAQGLVEQLTIETRAGEPVYLGVVKVEEIFTGISKPEVHVTLERRPKAESEAWNRILAAYKDSAWNEPIRKRLASLAASGG